jgi:type IV fimbrial biogenesis protein FimT
MQRGFTLIELMITLAVMGVLVTLAAPSFYDFILMQRLKAASQQFVTDMQFARSEAAARNQPVRVHFRRNSAVSCYAIFTAPDDTACQCERTPVCSGIAGAEEIRTVRLARASRIGVWPFGVSGGSLPAFRFDPINGSVKTNALDLTGLPIDQFAVDFSILGVTDKLLRSELQLSGRSNICVPAGSLVQGTPC